MFLLIIILLFIPLIFQGIVGNKSAYEWISLKFWAVCVISTIGQIFMTILSCYIMIKILDNKGIRDGMPIAGVAMLGIFIWMIMVVVMGFQLHAMINFKNRNK